MNNLEQLPGETPLDDEDFQGLIPTWIATRGDLNAAEASNIARGIIAVEKGKQFCTFDGLLNINSMQQLHNLMFSDVWRWSGQWRQRETNIGCAPYQIQQQLQDLLLDVSTQVADLDNLPWSQDEIAVRFHHRLVSIHPFVNGNGRHARLAADILGEQLGRSVFQWGSSDLTTASEQRTAYLSALRIADTTNEYEPLLKFARSI